MEKHLSEDIRFANKFLYAVQMHRIALGGWIAAKERDGIAPSKRTMQLFDDMGKQEKAAKRMAKDIVSLTAIWDEFFMNVSGVGECLATSLIAEIGDISRFDTVTKLWAYAALIAQYTKSRCSNGHKLIMSSDNHKECPVFDNKDKEPCGGTLYYEERVEGKAPKREKGYHYLFNSRLKKICWQVSEQLVKQGDKYYRDIYDKAKVLYIAKAAAEGKEVVPAERIKTKADKEKYISKMHIHNKAKRKMVKMFLSNLWEAWRLCEGHEARPPYVIEKLGHQGYVKWAEVKELLREAREQVKEASKETVEVKS